MLAAFNRIAEFQLLIYTFIFTDAPLVLEPSATVFHYAQALFEGLKAYRDAHGRITLFRPDMNMRRMNSSAARVALPVRTVSLAHLLIYLIPHRYHYPDI